MWKPTNQPTTTPARPNEPERPTMSTPSAPAMTASEPSQPRARRLPPQRTRRRSASRLSSRAKSPAPSLFISMDASKVPSTSRAIA